MTVNPYVLAKQYHEGVYFGLQSGKNAKNCKEALELADSFLEAAKYLIRKRIASAAAKNGRKMGRPKKQVA